MMQAWIKELQKLEKPRSQYSPRLTLEYHPGQPFTWTAVIRCPYAVAGCGRTMEEAFYKALLAARGGDGGE